MTSTAVCYEILLAEELDPRWREWFLGLEVLPAAEHPGTLLRGRLPDQAALFGLLARVRDLGLTLVEIRSNAEL